MTAAEDRADDRPCMSNSGDMMAERAKDVDGLKHVPVTWVECFCPAVET